MEDKKYSLRRMMLFKLNNEKAEIRAELKNLNYILMRTMELENTIRHCKKEEFTKLLEDPKLKSEYEAYVAKLKGEDNVERRELEERSEPSASESEQLSDEPKPKRRRSSRSV